MSAPDATVPGQAGIHVVHVVRQYHPSIGGMEEVVANIARQHVASGAGTAEVVTLDRLFADPDTRLPGRDAHDGVGIRRLAYSGSSRYPLCPSVLSAIGAADVVHVHGIDFFFDYLALTRALHRRPMIVSTHGGFFHTAYASRLKTLWFQTITRASALAYRRVVATSDNDGELFAPVVDASRLRVIENGVDIEKFAGRGSVSPGKTLIYFGRWSTNKGIVEALDLLRALVDQDGEWRMIVAGRPFDLSGDDIARAVAERGLDAQVDVVASPSQAQLAEQIARAQYFVCLSRHEGFGIAAIEAMSAGLVPVLSAIPPFRKLVADSAMGVLVDKADPQAAVCALRTLADDGADAFAARRGRAIDASARHDWHRVGQRYAEEYRRAVGRDPQAAA